MDPEAVDKVVGPTVGVDTVDRVETKFGSLSGPKEFRMDANTGPSENGSNDQPDVSILIKGQNTVEIWRRHRVNARNYSKRENTRYLEIEHCRVVS